MRIEVEQDGLVVAAVEGDDIDMVMYEAMHYAAVYGQGGPVMVTGVTPEIWDAWHASGPHADREGR